MNKSDAARALNAARKRKVSPERRAEIAQGAAVARWANDRKKKQEQAKEKIA